MTRIYLIIFIVLLLLMCLFADEDTGWVSTPPRIVFALVGEILSLPWEFDITAFGPVTGSSIYKHRNSGVSLTLIRRSDNQTWVRSSRFSNFKNAGITIINVTLNDSGIYRSSVYFQGGLQLHDEVLVKANIYEGKPNHTTGVSVVTEIPGDDSETIPFEVSAASGIHQSNSISQHYLILIFCAASVVGIALAGIIVYCCIKSVKNRNYDSYQRPPGNTKT